MGFVTGAFDGGCFFEVEILGLEVCLGTPATVVLCSTRLTLRDAVLVVGLVEIPALCWYTEFFLAGGTLLVVVGDWSGAGVTFSAGLLFCFPMALVEAPFVDFRGVFGGALPTFDDLQVAGDFVSLG